MMKKSKSKQKDQQSSDPSSIKLPPRAHVPIARCRVQMLGRAAPTDNPDGILAMQKPLRELYDNYSTVESVLTAYTSGLVLRTPADDPSAEELWFPIQDLLECGAMRLISGQSEMWFAPLSSVEAQASRSPALFAFVFKRRDIPVADCWAVECKSSSAAMALLTACMLAHKNPAGWGSAVDRPPSTIANKQTTARLPPSEEWDGAAAKEAALWSDKFPQDYYEKPPLQGFYYTPKPGLIQQFAISGNDDENDGTEQPIRQQRRMIVRDDYQPHAGDQDDHCPPCQRQAPEDSYYPPCGAIEDGCYPPHGAPEDAYYPQDMGGPAGRGAAAGIYPRPPELYRHAGMDESAMYPDDDTDSDSHNGKKHKKHGKKKKSKHSKKKDKKSEMIIVPETAVTYHGAASQMSEEPFETCLPIQPQDQYVVEDYDPEWHYNMKSYIRDQQHINGYTEPTPTSYRPYQSHIDHFPPVDYIDGQYYDDDGPYERRLPVAAQSDPKRLNSNFILRQSDDYRRHL